MRPVPSPPQLRELADGLFVWEHDVTDRFTSNVGVVVEDDGLTLVDCGARPSSYLALRDRLAAFGRPVTTVVLTHAHPDHVAGVVAFPDAEVVAATATAQALAAPVPVEALQALHPPVAAELAGLTNPTPTRLVDAPALAGRLDLFVLRGHSEADLVASVPDADVCFTGDLCFFGFTPLGIGADFLRWRLSLDWLPETGRFVPGHGTVGTRAEVDLVAAYLDAVLAAAESGGPDDDAGVTLDGPWAGWWHPWRDEMPDAVDRINVEQARHPGKLPPTVLRLAGFT
jgi:glyoxylase-like metal-dependent hydrolase (beta-lactamase superfamily II)